MSSFPNKKLTPRISNNRERVPTPFSVANTKGFIFMDPAIVQTRAPGSMSTATYEVREIVLSAEAREGAGIIIPRNVITSER